MSKLGVLGGAAHVNPVVVSVAGVLEVAFPGGKTMQPPGMLTRKGTVQRRAIAARDRVLLCSDRGVESGQRLAASCDLSRREAVMMAVMAYASGVEFGIMRREDFKVASAPARPGKCRDTTTLQPA